MYNPVQESLENCSFIITQIMDTKCLDNDKFRMVLLGFLATILSPLFVLIYIIYGLLKCCSVLVPLISLLIVLVVGLPLLTISKILYGFYTVTYNVLMYFYQTAIVANISRLQADSQSQPPCVSSSHLGEQDYPPHVSHE